MLNEDHLRIKIIYEDYGMRNIYYHNVGDDLRVMELKIMEVGIMEC